MIRDKKELDHRPIEIDLTGPEGNVFHLMAYAKKYARQLYDFMTDELEDAQSINEVMNELYDESVKGPESMGDYIVQRMMESDYENAVEVFDHYFGRVVILYR